MLLGSCKVRRDADRPGSVRVPAGFRLGLAVCYLGSGALVVLGDRVVSMGVPVVSHTASPSSGCPDAGLAPEIEKVASLLFNAPVAALDMLQALGGRTAVNVHCSHSLCILSCSGSSWRSLQGPDSGPACEGHGLPPNQSLSKCRAARGTSAHRQLFSCCLVGHRSGLGNLACFEHWPWLSV